MSTDRLPPLAREAMDAGQIEAFDALANGPRGHFAGPFPPLLRSPELLNRVQKVGEYLRFHSPLPARVRELAILVVARRWSQDYEWGYHLPLALEAGVSRATCEAIADGRRPDGLPEDEEAAFAVLQALDDAMSVPDDLYDAAVARFGERGVIDLIALGGYYSLLAMVMNVARTPGLQAEIALGPAG